MDFPDPRGQIKVCTAPPRSQKKYRFESKLRGPLVLHAESVPHRASAAAGLGWAPENEAWRRGPATGNLHPGDSGFLSCSSVCFQVNNRDREGTKELRRV